MVFVLILFYPFLEIYSIIHVSGIIGGWETFWLLIMSGLLGLHLIRNQGFSSWVTYQEQVQKGVAPSLDPLQNLLVLLGGILLLVPGFISDFFGILLIVPFTRQLFLKTISSYLKNKIQSGQFKVYSQTTYYGDVTPPSSKMKDVTPVTEKLTIMEVKKE